MSEARPSAVESASVFSSYSPTPGVYDEAVDADGNVRPHWQELFAKLDGIGMAELQRRWENAQQDTAADGATFHPHEADGEGARPWVLDALPFLLPEHDWRELSEGLGQRAILLDHILRDLLGPQVLLREKILPPEVLFGSPAYHPAFHGLRPAGRRQLDVYGADVSRGPSGTWFVTGDRTRTVSGLGYALENRVVASRMLSQVFRLSRVRRLAEFFVALKEMVRIEAPRSQENPQVVLWTEGPSAPRYFEDAYLARYLGYTLVEGGDLAVRANRLRLKTLGGLQPVEVVLRRLDDALCDPVELRPDSTSGVSGILGVLRARNVAMVNTPGSSIVEAPVLLPFLRTACRILLDADLKIPSLATWWCGQEKERAYVLEHLDELIVRPAFPPATAAVWRPERMSAEDKAELVAAIQARPADYVAQQAPARSTTPVWNPSGVESWPLALRTFLVAREDTYVRMPGGLARVAPDPALLDHTVSSGERSQDVWILSEGPVDTASLLTPPGEMIALRRGGAELPSRVADNLFWLGRSVEGAEGTARLLRTLFATVADDALEAPALPFLLSALADAEAIDRADFYAMDSSELMRTATSVAPVVFDPARPGSLRARILETQRIASLVRDRVSVDAWRIVQRLEEVSRLPRWRVGTYESTRMLERVIRELASLAGLVNESMTRAPAWRFLDLGRRIARAWHTARLVGATLVPPASDDRALLEAVLSTADSLMTYRSRYMATLQAGPVIDLLLTDDTNPRSIGYQLTAVVDHVAELPRDDTQAALGPEQRLALSLQNSVRLADPAELMRSDADGRRVALERLMQRLVEQLPRLSDALSSRFLTHAGLPRHLASSSGGQRR